jgi:hypothetical protein
MEQRTKYEQVLSIPGEIGVGADGTHVHLRSTFLSSQAIRLTLVRARLDLEQASHRAHREGCRHADKCKARIKLWQAVMLHGLRDMTTALTLLLFISRDAPHVTCVPASACAN